MSVYEYKFKVIQFVCCKVIMVLDICMKEIDKSGVLMIQFLKEYDMQIVFYEIVKDD